MMNSSTPRVRKALAGLLGLLLLASGLSAWLYSPSLAEKLLTKMIMPCGIVFLALLIAVVIAFSTQQRRWAWAALILWLFYWTAGSSYTANLLVGTLEQRYESIDPKAMPEFDVVIVLGGSTQSDERGNVWLSPSGDRVMLAARMYGQGKAKRLVATGRLHDWFTPNRQHMADATDRIWRELGVPADRITKIGGINTSEEMKEIRALFPDRLPARIGLITSAFHMPRAQRLARQNNLQLTPIPAGFLHDDTPFPISLIPSAGGLQMTEFTLKEYLAALFCR